MNTRSFYTQLISITLITGATFAALCYAVPGMEPFFGFSALSIGLFAGLCILLYYLGVSASKSSSKTAFTNLISISVFGKMVLSLAFLLLYRHFAAPPNQWFVPIFLIAYIVYTAFEVRFMMKLAKG
ncbi:MAG: hypothetical protein J0L99_07020 [Chitinophagales bacterium]|nr:hypothetical protein [Chitinophagales bacterium]